MIEAMAVALDIDIVIVSFVIEPLRDSMSDYHNNYDWR